MFQKLRSENKPISPTCKGKILLSEYPPHPKIKHRKGRTTNEHEETRIGNRRWVYGMGGCDPYRVAGVLGGLLSVGTSPSGSRTHGYADSPLRDVCPPGMGRDGKSSGRGAGGHGDGWGKSGAMRWVCGEIVLTADGADGRRFFGGMFFWACLIRVISCLFVVKKSRRRNTIFGSFSILESVFWDNAEGCGNVEES